MFARECSKPVTRRRRTGVPGATPTLVPEAKRPATERSDPADDEAK